MLTKSEKMSIAGSEKISKPKRTPVKKTKK